MGAFLPDYAFLSDLFPSGLKLGLDQTDNLSVLRHQLLHRNQHFGQGDERNIYGYKLNFIINILRCHVPDVGFFHADDTRVISKLPRELPVAHIHGIDLYGPILEHAVGKAAC